MGDENESMNGGCTRRRRTKRPSRCPNVLFERWLQEMYQSVPEDSNMRFVYGRALKSLRKHPLKLSSGKDCRILQNFGQKLCDALDKKLEEHLRNGGNMEDLHLIEEPSDKDDAASSRKRMEARTEIDVSSRSRKPRSQKEYVPVPRSGPYALLVTLHQVTLEPCHKGFMTKSELIDRAQPLCDASFTRPTDPNSHYTAWSSMGSLINKNLVIKAGNPGRYSLTKEGIDLAEKLVNVSLFGPAASSSGINQDPGSPPSPSISKAPKKTASKKDSSSGGEPARRRKKSNQSATLTGRTEHQSEDSSSFDIVSQPEEIAIDDSDDEVVSKRFKASNEGIGLPLPNRGSENETTSKQNSVMKRSQESFHSANSAPLEKLVYPPRTANKTGTVLSASSGRTDLLSNRGSQNGAANEVQEVNISDDSDDDLSNFYSENRDFGNCGTSEEVFIEPEPRIGATKRSQCLRNVVTASENCGSGTSVSVSARESSFSNSGSTLKPGLSGKVVFKAKKWTSQLLRQNSDCSNSSQSDCSVDMVESQKVAVRSGLDPVYSTSSQSERSGTSTFKFKKWTGLGNSSSQDAIQTSLGNSSSQDALQSDGSVPHSNLDQGPCSSKAGFQTNPSVPETQRAPETSSQGALQTGFSSSVEILRKGTVPESSNPGAFCEHRTNSLDLEVGNDFPEIEDPGPSFVEKIKNEIVEILQEDGVGQSSSDTCEVEGVARKSSLTKKSESSQSLQSIQRKGVVDMNSVCLSKSASSSASTKWRSENNQPTEDWDSDELPDFSEMLRSSRPTVEYCESTSNDGEITVLSVSPKKYKFLYVYLTPEGQETCHKDKAEVLFDESDGFVGYACVCVKKDLFSSGKKYRNLTERINGIVKIFMQDLYCADVSTAACERFLQPLPPRTTSDLTSVKSITIQTSCSSQSIVKPSPSKGTDLNKPRVDLNKVKVVNPSPAKFTPGSRPAKNSPSKSLHVDLTSSDSKETKSYKTRLNFGESSSSESMVEKSRLVSVKSRPDKSTVQSTAIVKLVPNGASEKYGTKSSQGLDTASSSRDFSYQSSVQSTASKTTIFVQSASSVITSDGRTSQVLRTASSSQDIASSSQEGSTAASLVSVSSVRSNTVDSQQLPATDIPVRSVLLKPGQFRVFLLVDTGETAGSLGRSNQKLLTLDELRKQDIPFEVRRLNVGDYVWVARSSSDPSDELVLPYIVERKRLDDLASSIKDGRYREQKFRMRRCGIQNLIYLVEEYGNRNYLGLPEKSVIQAIINTQVIDDFRVHWTNNTAESVSYVKRLTALLSRKYMTKTLASSSATETNPGPLETLMTFDEFSRYGNKRKALTISETFGKQLMQLHGVSDKKAAIIITRFPTPHSLFEAYKNCSSEKEKEELLSGGKNKTGISLQISKTVGMLFNRESV